MIDLHVIGHLFPTRSVPACYNSPQKTTVVKDFASQSGINALRTVLNYGHWAVCRATN